MKFVISSGHGKYIRGASGAPVPPQLDEVDEARRVVNQVATVLRGMGVGVVTFHDDTSHDQSTNLDTIVKFHNKQTRDYDISVHFNAYDHTAHGCEVLYVSQKALAQKVAGAICAVTGFTKRGDNGAVYRNNLAFLNGTNEPAILIETCFCDHTGDANTFKAKFNAICTAISEAVSGQSAGTTPPPVEPERPPIEVPPPASGAHPELRKGSTGPAVVELQRKLAVVTADGDFGSITEIWVKGFQGSCSLTPDGVVGPKTWTEVDALDARLKAGEPPLPKALADQIYTLAQTSEIADYSWPDRGVPPHGYIAGMALGFATAFRRSEAGDVAARTMGQPLGNTDKDALAWYRSELTAKGLTFDSWDARLRALFTLQIGLGPRESSGRYFEGRDMSATNVQSDTCEAGLTQTSWNIRSANASIGPLLPEFWGNPNGFLDVFKEGLSPTANNLNSYGSGDGLKYQWLSRFCPLFHVLVTAVGLRTLRAHWGPIGRKEVTIKSEAHELLIGVQDLLEGGGV